METLAQLVSRSLAAYGIEPRLDHRRLQWSKWFRCESSFSVVLVPAKPGVFALAEEIAVFGANDGIADVESPVPQGKRMLALFQISEAHDIGMALGRLFLPGSPLRERLEQGHCFARYVVLEDLKQRQSAYKALQQWLSNASDVASGIASAAPLFSESFAGNHSQPAGQAELQTEINGPASLPDGF